MHHNVWERNGTTSSSSTSSSPSPLLRSQVLNTATPSVTTPATISATQSATISATGTSRKSQGKRVEHHLERRKHELGAINRSATRTATHTATYAATQTATWLRVPTRKPRVVIFLIHASTRVSHFAMLEITKHESLEWRKLDDLEDVRSKTDFEVLGTLGEGGFGKAFKVRNKVDGKVYAMKKVLLPAVSEEDEDLKKVLREVQLLSSLDSPLVVRYYSAWMEKGRDETMQSGAANSAPAASSSADWSASDSGLFASSSSSRSFWQNTFRRPLASGSRHNSDDADDNATSGSTSHKVSSTSEGLPRCHLCKSCYEDWEVSFEQWGLIDAVLQPLDLCINCYMESLPSTIDASNIQIRRRQVYASFLFILMELCDYTLTEYLAMPQGDDESKRESQSPHQATTSIDDAHGAADTMSGDDHDDNLEREWSLFRQSVAGVMYLHEQGVIHRDIKPSNIFVQNGAVKIGDLGLATMISTSRKERSKTSGKEAKEGAAGSGDPQTQRSSQVGTFLYSAPEVTSGQYDEACDVFSLGVLLVEIFAHFETAMERAVILGALSKSKGRSGQYLQSLLEGWSATNPVAAHLVDRMTHADPSQRYSCKQVLEYMDRELETKRLSVSDGVGDASAPSAEADVANRTEADGRGTSGPTSERSDGNTDESDVASLQRQLATAQQTITKLRALLDDHGIAHDDIR